MSYRKSTLVFAALAALAACSDDDDGPTGNEGTATVRVVNASPTNATVSLASGSTTLASNVAFGTTAACIEVPAGPQVLTFQSGGTNLASTLGVNLEANTNYTVVLSGTTATAATWFTDEYTAPTAGNTMLRVLNATGTAGDVYVTTADAAIAGTPTVAGLGAGLVTPYTSTPNTNLRARLFNVGNTTTARGDVTFTTPASGAGTVVFTAAPTGGTTTGFLVEPCT